MLNCTISTFIEYNELQGFMMLGMDIHVPIICSYGYYMYLYITCTSTCTNTLPVAMDIGTYYTCTVPINSVEGMFVVLESGSLQTTS